MEQTSMMDNNVTCFAALLDITPEEFLKAMVDTGLSGEEIVSRYFDLIM